MDLATNITGTMPTTIFLFILEPNLAILCVSIPMLRPFWARYKESTRGASKLHEGYSDMQTIGGSGAKKSGQRSKIRTGNDTENLTQWEMDDYTQTPMGKNDATVTYAGDESGSEKNLTTPSQVPRHMIGVETEWTVTRG